MQLTQEQKGQIEDIMKGVECSKTFECYKSGLTHLGKVHGIGANGFLECLEQDSQDCQFSLPFGNLCSCLCPVRIYVATEFKK